MLWTFVPVAVLLSMTPGPQLDETCDHAFASGLLTAFANSTLAVFFVALFPQFIPDAPPSCPMRSRWRRS
jgi:threonine/homoserine/homoserine lactone efflux protein